MTNEIAPRIAVVDDEPSFREFIAILLQHYGYAVLLLDSAAGAVEALAVYAPDIIILDLLFGHEALGWEVLADLRTNPCLATTPVILCTAAPQHVAGRAGGLCEQQTWVLLKPFHLEEINTLLCSLLAQRNTSSAK